MCCVCSVRVREMSSLSLDESEELGLMDGPIGGKTTASSALHALAAKKKKGSKTGYFPSSSTGTGGRWGVGGKAEFPPIKPKTLKSGDDDDKRTFPPPPPPSSRRSSYATKFNMVSGGGLSPYEGRVIIGPVMDDSQAWQGHVVTAVRWDPERRARLDRTVDIKERIAPLGSADSFKIVAKEFAFAEVRYPGSAVGRGSSQKAPDRIVTTVLNGVKKGTLFEFVGWIPKEPETYGVDYISFTVAKAGTGRVRNTGTRPIANGDIIYFDTTPVLFCSTEGKEPVPRIQDPTLPGYSERFPFPIYALDPSIQTNGQSILLSEIEQEADRYVAATTPPPPDGSAVSITYVQSLCESMYAVGNRWLSTCGVPANHPLRMLCLWYAVSEASKYELLNSLDSLFAVDFSIDRQGYARLFEWAIGEQNKFEQSTSVYGESHRVPDEIMVYYQSLSAASEKASAKEAKTVAEALSKLIVMAPRLITRRIAGAITAISEWQNRYIIATALSGGGAGDLIDVLITKIVN
jgi:hypothetical protein